MDIFLAAPTGRAAKRMSETTGFEARTIHRMLELNGGMEGSAGFERNETNPLETDLVIIDEMSMVDITLMNSLLKAIAPITIFKAVVAIDNAIVFNFAIPRLLIYPPSPAFAPLRLVR